MRTYVNSSRHQPCSVWLQAICPGGPFSRMLKGTEAQMLHGRTLALENRKELMQDHPSLGQRSG